MKSSVVQRDELKAERIAKYQESDFDRNREILKQFLNDTHTLTLIHSNPNKKEPLPEYSLRRGKFIIGFCDIFLGEPSSIKIPIAAYNKGAFMADRFAAEKDAGNIRLRYVIFLFTPDKALAWSYTRDAKDPYNIWYDASGCHVLIPRDDWKHVTDFNNTSLGEKL